MGAMGWACKLGNEDCVDKVRAQFRVWMERLNPDTAAANPVDVNMKQIVYCNAIRYGGEREWDFGWERYQKSNVGSEKSVFLGALACTKEVWLLNRYLNMSLTEESGVRKQDG